MPKKNNDTKKEVVPEEEIVPNEVIEESETDKQVKLQSIAQSVAEVKKIEAETRRAEADALRSEIEAKKLYAAYEKELFSDDHTYQSDEMIEETDYQTNNETEKLFDQDDVEVEDFEIPAFLRKQKF